MILTIESSCDETSAALVSEDGRRIFSNVVASQIPIHRRYGGVVPELASRNHILEIHRVLDQALQGAGLASLALVKGVGVTCGPGLVGSLLVGIETAKSLAYMHDVPCVGLNHLEGHLTACLIQTPESPQPPPFPYIGLVASGGHSDLYLVEAMGVYTALGRTRDDAAGEAFDKVAKMLGLPYPGGVEIDRRAAQGNPKAIDFPRPMWTRKTLDFSFAGLKTAVLMHLKAHGLPQGEHALADLCASFQAAVVDLLVMKTMAAATARRIKHVVLSGGVACNSALRHAARAQGEDQGITVHLAPKELCTDNAAMLGPAAAHALAPLIAAGQGFRALDLRAQSQMPLGQDERTPSLGPHR